MDYIIQFVGIILIVSSTQRGVPYRAYVPMSVGGEKPCPGQLVGVPKHDAYIRIPDDAFVSSSNWPQANVKDDCAPNCKLFKITEASTISVASGFRTGQEVHERVSYCLVPDVNAEMTPQHNLGRVNESGAIVKMDLPGGDLVGDRLSNGAMIAELHVPAPPEALTAPSTITISVTSGSGPKTIVVKAGSTITVMNSTPELADQPLETRDPHALEHPHFTLFSKLFDSATPICQRFPAVRPCGSMGQPFGPGVIGDEICSVGRIRVNGGTQ